MYNINDRIKVDNDLGTVRYIGQVEQWGDIVAFGIEWDDATRGKNNGNIGSKQYFIPTVNRSASFIKLSSSKICKRVSVKEALEHTYGIEDNRIVENIRIGNKVVENHGFDKLNQFNAVFHQLESVSLDNKAIYKSDIITLPCVKSLDLSFNLFTSIAEIWLIVDQLPQLEELNINGNRILEFCPPKVTHRLVTLKLAATRITTDDLNTYILGKFPGLQNLVISSNNYSEVTLPKLKYVDLSFNNLTVIPNLDVESLNISDNRINAIYGTYTMKDLDLRHNCIKLLRFIDDIYENFQLESLRINSNPVFDNMPEDEMEIHVISRLNNTQLKKLNGSKLTPEQVTNAELFYVSKIKSGEIELTTSKWDILKQKYHVDKNIVFKKESPILHLSIYKAGGDLVLERDVLHDYTILRIKGLVSKSLGISILKFQLFYHVNETYKQYLDQEISQLKDYSFNNPQILYIEICK